MGTGHFQRESNKPSWNSDERLNDKREQENLFSEIENTQRRSRGRSRSRSPTSQSTPRREDAAERLEDARKEIREAAEKRREDREAQMEDTVRRYVQIEGRLQPDGWGYVERMPRGHRPVPEDSSTTGWQSSASNHNGVASADISTEAANLLTESKRFGPHMVPLGKQTPLREVVTKHKSANAIQRPQSKISIVENVQNHTAEDQKDWDYSDIEDDEIF